MSALDDMAEWARRMVFDGGIVRRPRPDFDVALAELALLRRCRDAVVGLVATSQPGIPWWYMETTLGSGCSHCDSTSSSSRDWPAPEHVIHAADCPALAIDALAKEVGGE